MIKICEVCKNPFKTIQAKIKQGNGKFCSRKCYGIYKKGKPSWNSGIKTGIIPKTVFKKGENIGIKNIKWKGEKAGYLAIHTWVKRHIKFFDKCSVCGKKSKKIELANIDHKYKRDIKDFIHMCTSCHRKHDFRKGLTKYCLNKFKFKKGNNPPQHKIGCECFRCFKIPWNKHKTNHLSSPLLLSPHGQVSPR